MSENISAKPLRCPNCRHELEVAIGEDVHAIYDLKFSQKRGTYIPFLSVKDAGFVCSLCGKKLPKSFFEKLIARNLVALNMSYLKKTFLVEALAQQ